MGQRTCRLCKSSPAAKQNSHIIPQFLYRRIEKAIIFDKFHNEPYPATSSNSLCQGKILCKNCERLLAEKIETPVVPFFQLFLNKEKSFIETVSPLVHELNSPMQVRIYGIDEDKLTSSIGVTRNQIFLFIWSILFRISIAKENPQIPDFDFPLDDFGEKLRYSLLNTDYSFVDQKENGIIISASLDKQNQHRNCVYFHHGQGYFNLIINLFHFTFYFDRIKSGVFE